jgi:polyferredoxin
MVGAWGTHRWLRWLIACLTLAVSTFLAIGFFGAWHPAADSVGHFRHLAAPAALACALVALWLVT